ncbi:origin recognition complex subunit 6 isoform X2 [Agrilus planipennis]|uniref:Origin recognition complex subunit 6 isoform X2 n=1 Tax=Agrilus planipennis TaxID=224129 RepID=A0A1W4XA61_AGRPL|nr:origin recognition complex subunit 6 isoform X2 [Agrilus planipennis]
MSDRTLLIDLIKRLNISEGEAVLCKGEEYYRVLLNKTLLRNLNNTAKAILCLELAATNLGVKFDRCVGIKLSGFRKQVYQNHLHTIEKILDLDKPVTIKEICSQHNCRNVESLAGEILEKFRIANNIPDDVVQSHYVTAAVYEACILKKIKVQKSHFITASRLKSSKWKELESQFNELVKKEFLSNEEHEENKGFDKLFEDCKSDGMENMKMKKIYNWKIMRCGSKEC